MTDRSARDVQARFRGTGRTMTDHRAVVSSLLERHGRTYADELGLDLEKNTPTALFGLLLFTVLSSARIRAANATQATRALLDAGWSSVPKLAESTWEQRVKVLNQHGYARYDERTARMLGELTEHLQTRWHGDLRRLRDEAGGNTGNAEKLLAEFSGIGPVGADIFLREVQQAWPEFRPFVDRRAREAAKKLGLPGTPEALAALVGAEDLARLVAALVRSSLEHDEGEVAEAARD